MPSLIDDLRAASIDAGFQMMRVAPAVESTGFDRLVQWIDEGYAGQMHYFANRLNAYRHPDSVLSGVRSIVVLAYPYACHTASQLPPGHGKVARYAWGERDYHDVIHAKLKRLCELTEQAAPGSRSRGVVDTAPLAEREYAQLAGLGWQGKNTLLLNPAAGSYFFLACILTTVELPIDAPFDSYHCGTCTACLDACPTDAFVQPNLLDATQCISYLTIEHRGAIDPELRHGIGDWVFGCDVCQEVCPWNKKRSKRREDQNRENEFPNQSMNLIDLMSMTEQEFRQRFRHTPMWRPRRRGLLRNAAIVMGNQRDPNSIPALIRGLNDDESVIRGAAAWALGQIGGHQSMTGLQHRQAIESDPEVSDEISAALSRFDSETA